MTKKQEQALEVLQELFGTKTAYELNREVERLAKIIRTDSAKEAGSKFKSKFTK